MRKSKGISTWVLVAALGVGALITLACDGKSAKYPTQPPARNLTVPVTTTAVLADFTVTTTADPFTFGFQDASTGDPTGWRWNLGDGKTVRAAQTVTHTYKKPGLYAVTLTVSNAISQDTVTKFIEVVEETEEEPEPEPEEGEGEGG